MGGTVVARWRARRDRRAIAAPGRSWTTRAALLLLASPMFDSGCGCDQGPSTHHVTEGSFAGAALGLVLLGAQLAVRVRRHRSTSPAVQGILPFRAAVTWWGLGAVALAAAAVTGVLAGIGVVTIGHVLFGQSSEGGPPSKGYLILGAFVVVTAAGPAAYAVACVALSARVRRGLDQVIGLVVVVLPTVVFLFAKVRGHRADAFAIVSAAVSVVLLLARAVPVPRVPAPISGPAPPRWTGPAVVPVTGRVEEPPAPG